MTRAARRQIDARLAERVRGKHGQVVYDLLTDFDRTPDEVRARFSEYLDTFDVIVGWNSKLFDVPVLNARLLYHGMRPYQPRMHLDLMYKASGSSISIGRKSLDNVSKYFGVQNQKTPLDPRTWDDADHGDKSKYAKIIEHCEADVLVLRDVYEKLKPMVHILHR
jgi:uncharacterized protein YprB with RNaseH-like and TPR domain